LANHSLLLSAFSIRTTKADELKERFNPTRFFIRIKQHLTFTTQIELLIKIVIYKRWAQGRRPNCPKR